MPEPATRPPKLTPNQREYVRQLLKLSLPRADIFRLAGVTPQQVAAVAAHVTMGTYPAAGRGQPQPPADANLDALDEALAAVKTAHRTAKRLRQSRSKNSRSFAEQLERTARAADVITAALREMAAVAVAAEQARLAAGDPA